MNSEPVEKLESLDARNKTSLDTSSDSPSLFSGVFSIRLLTASSVPEHQALEYELFPDELS